MADSFFFYDLETSGFSPRSSRIMQFAGQRTDMELKPVGEPVNILVKLTPDVLPSPDAVLVTGITPQQTLSEGVTEAEFLKVFHEEVVTPGTIFVGFNSIRFDDEFMRFLHYRNFYDPYEWQWRDSCSRWDLLDVVRMTRALRPEGINWPFAPDGKPANRLEFLTAANKLQHSNAHDALSDVRATIAVAQLIRSKQKDLFEYLLGIRGKQKISELVLKGAPFVYTSGRYGSEYLHTTVAVLLAKHPKQDAALVYDLRYNPTAFLGMSVDELVEAWKLKPQRGVDETEPEAPALPRLPIKTLKYNRCAAVAPLGVIKGKVTQDRIQLPLEITTKHLEILKQHRTDFVTKVVAAVDQLDQERAAAQTALLDNEQTVDERLYEGFINDNDKTVMSAVRGAKPEDFSQLADRLHDNRLKSLLPLYKARNYPASLSQEERAAWDTFCQQRLLAGDADSRLAKYFARLQELMEEDRRSDRQQYILEELRLYGESLMPTDGLG